MSKKIDKKMLTLYYYIDMSSLSNISMHTRHHFVCAVPVCAYHHCLHLPIMIRATD